MSATVRTTGPLFQATTESLRARDVEAMEAAVRLLGPRARQALTGGIVRLGPPRFGHIGEQIRGEVRQEADRIVGRVFPQGPAAFLEPMLERGTRGHFIGARGFGRGGRGRRSRSNPARRHTLRFLAGGRTLFRPFVHHPGTPAFRPFGRTLDASRAEIITALGARFREALGGA